MPRLPKFLRTAFGYASIVSSAVFMALAPFLFKAPLPHATSRFHADAFALLLIAMREVILVMPGIMAISTGLAWWSLRKGLPTARSRALAASVSCLVMSTPFLVADFAIINYSLAGPVEFTGVLIVCATLLSMGIVGLFAFGKRKAPIVESARSRITNEVEGMGTLIPTA